MKAERLLARGHEADEAGERVAAIALYEQAASEDPGWAAPHYNLGLLFKYAGQWRLSLEHNQRALERDAEHEAATWNLGIAATALGEWAIARQAWRDFGIQVPDGDGPLDLPCGYNPIRINPGGDGEVVWCQRIDPARARITSIPLPDSEHRFGDIVLNDGAPNGTRMLNGREVPVFDELELLERSPFSTFEAEVRMQNHEAHMRRLAELAHAMGGAAEDWSTSVRVICRQCSEGRPHEEHDHDNRFEGDTHRIAVAATSYEHATEILQAWEADEAEIEVQWLDDALPSGAPEPDAPSE